MAWTIGAGGLPMKIFSELPTVYLHRDAVDFRMSINGLVCIVEMQMNLSPFDDALFMFCNKNKDKIKIVYWDKTGFALWYKRLDKSRFKWPSKITDATLPLSAQQFDWLLAGFEVIGHQSLHDQSVA
jgi:transposase